jgi:hypothetical protein
MSKIDLPTSTQQKSKMLARLLGWHCVYAAESVCAIISERREYIGISTAFWYEAAGPHVDFYEAENMALAWKIMTSMLEMDPEVKAIFENWWQNQFLYRIKSPKVAQRLWLDKVLELAIDTELLRV